MQFSGIVKLSDVSDFISASQDCVVASNAPSRTPIKATKEPVKISLRDCLACSGCVTSAETALLENQSSDEFLQKLSDPEIKVAVSVSSQARAALAVAFDMSPNEVECPAVFTLKGECVCAADEMLDRMASVDGCGHCV